LTQGSFNLRSHTLVCFVSLCPPLGVTNNHPSHAKVSQHFSADIASMRHGLIGTDRLRTDPIATKLINSNLQVGKRRTNTPIYAGLAGSGNTRCKRLGLLSRSPHFPIADD
jgi:hypothetical protein